ncbi:hypothetical protein MRB53_021821 [Persea americana]|uniref:Uncharacterized protein n=1 Tax=Persea americana TaxID=3435 RepID=A0ACC2L649_PERAE|nr:hypothetical protein MRB53_021821 [Persea americana]
MGTPLTLPIPSLPPASLPPWEHDQLLLLHNHLNSLLPKSSGNPSLVPSHYPKTYASCLSPAVFSPPPPIPPPVLAYGKLTIRISLQMVNLSKQSFSHSAIRKFIGRRPSLEAVEKWVESSWRLSRPCLISLTVQGNFIFRFFSKEDREALVGSSPLLMAGKKLLLRPWSPGQDESSWPSVAPVWIRLKGIPFHCWSGDILLSIAASIGKPLQLDEITAK